MAAASTRSSLCSYMIFRRVALFSLLVFLHVSLFSCRMSNGQKLLGKSDYMSRRALLDEVDVGEGGKLANKQKSFKEIQEVQTAKISKKVATISEELEADKSIKKKIANAKELDDSLAKKPQKKQADSSKEDSDDLNKKPQKKQADSIKEEADDLNKKRKKIDAANKETGNQELLPKMKKKPTIGESDLKKPAQKNSTSEQGSEKKSMKKTNTTTSADKLEKQSKKKTSLLNVQVDEDQPHNKTKIKLPKLIEDGVKNQTKLPNQNLTSSTAIKPPKSKSPPTVSKPKPKLKLPPQRPRKVDGEEDEDDLIYDFRNLPTKLIHDAIIPDLHRISTTSKLYLNRANDQISQSFKPLIGSKYASIVASFTSYIFLFAPILILPFLYTRIRTHFLPLQTILIFVQIYLAVYFAVLSLAFLATGQEPLGVFYRTSAASFVYMQLLQMTIYALYLLVLVVYIVAAFAGGGGSRTVGLVQAAVGFGVGAHYYVAVGRRAALGKAPRSNWMVHGVYAVLFTAACLLARAERRKKAYLHGGGGEDGKTS